MLVVVCITRDVLFVVTIIVRSGMHLVVVLLACELVSRIRERIRGCSYLVYFRGRKCLSGGEL